MNDKEKMPLSVGSALERERDRMQRLPKQELDTPSTYELLDYQHPISLESQPVPVEPDPVIYEMDHSEGMGAKMLVVSFKDYSNSVYRLQSALQRAQEELRTDWYLQAKRSDEMAKAWEREARELKEANRRMVEQYRDLVVAAENYLKHGTEPDCEALAQAHAKLEEA